MKNKSIYIICIALFCYCNIQSTLAEKLNLKCGVVLEGNIVSQIPGKDVTFSVVRTYAMVNSFYIAKCNKEIIKINSLDKTWKEWITEYNKTSKEQLRDNIVLSKIELMDKEKMVQNSTLWKKDSVKMNVLSSLFGNAIHQVCVLEEGAYLRFVDLSPAECHINISDIHSIEYPEREATAINGILDLIEVKSKGIYKGQILEKVLGDYIKLKTNEGIILNIFNKDIISQNKEGLNPNVSILEQAPSLDVVNGTRGIIVCQINDSSKPRIKMIDEDNHEKWFDLKDVHSIHSYKNEKYVPLNDVIINNQDVYFNRFVINPVPSPKKKKDLYVLSKEDISMMAELKLNSENSELTVEMSNTASHKSAILFPVYKINDGKDNIFAFSTKDIMDNPIAEESETVSKNGTLCKVYKVKSGYYALYIPNSGKYYFCAININKQ